MSDEMGDKFKQIAEMLGQNSNANIPDNVKGLLNMLSNSSTKEESHQDDIPQKPSTNGESPKADTDEVIDMTRKMKKAMNMLNPPNDPKVNLLNAIKPYLNKNRQKKLQTCMKLMKMGSLTKLFEELD
jgi:hypothetical protein